MGCNEEVFEEMRLARPKRGCEWFEEEVLEQKAGRMEMVKDVTRTRLKEMCFCQSFFGHRIPVATHSFKHQYLDTSLGSKVVE